MIAVCITVVDDTRGKTVEATISDTVPVAELIPHLVDATAGEHWQLSSPGGILRPEHGLGDAGVRPGEHLTLECAPMPVPPATTIEELSGTIPRSSAVWVAALLAAATIVLLAPVIIVNADSFMWHPLEMTDRARSLLSGAGDPAGNGGTTYTIVSILVTIAAATGSLNDRRFVSIAAILGFGVGIQINVLTGCVFAALSVWRSGPERILTICLAIAATVNFWPGVSALLAMTSLISSGHIALGIARIPLPKIPPTGLFSAATSSVTQTVPGNGLGTENTKPVDQITRIHSTLIIACCTVIGASVVQLIPLHSQPSWTSTVGCLTLSITGLSARGGRPVHSIAVTGTMSAVFIWTLLHCPSPWPVLAFLPIALPAINVFSPLIGRVIDVLETIAFAITVPLLIATTGVFDVIRGIG